VPTCGGAHHARPALGTPWPKAHRNSVLGDRGTLTERRDNIRRNHNACSTPGGSGAAPGPGLLRLKTALSQPPPSYYQCGRRKGPGWAVRMQLCERGRPGTGQAQVEHTCPALCGKCARRPASRSVACRGGRRKMSGSFAEHACTLISHRIAGHAVTGRLGGRRLARCPSLHGLAWGRWSL